MRIRFSILIVLTMAATTAVLFGCGAAPASQDNKGASTPETAVTVEDVQTETMEAPAEVGFEVGLRAPEFAMSLLDGTEVTASSLSDEGKPVFLYFHATY